MSALLVQHVRKVHREPALLGAHDEAIRKPLAVHAVHGAHPVGPLLRKGDPVAAAHFESGPTRVSGAHLETRRVDQAVDLVLSAAGHYTPIGNLLDTSALGIDERHIRTVVGIEVFVVKARPFAELTVVRLQGLGGR